jgi:hypothetical protein
MQKLILTLLLAVSAASAFAVQLMPYETPITVKAQIVRRTGIIREGEKGEFYFLKFSEPLDFRAL